MGKSTHEGHLSQTLQTFDKQFKIAVTILSVYNGVFNVTNSNNKFYFKKSLIEEDFIQIRIPIGAYEIESLNDEVKRNIIDEEHFTELEYPFLIKPNFSTLGSIIEIKTQGPLIGVVFIDSIGNLLGFAESLLYKEYNILHNPVDILSFDSIFTHTYIARGMIFKGESSDIIHNRTMDVDPGYKYIEKFRGGKQWYLMNTKDFISSINFKLKTEHDKLISFNGQNLTFRLSIKEI